MLLYKAAFGPDLGQCCFKQKKSRAPAPRVTTPRAHPPFRAPSLSRFALLSAGTQHSVTAKVAGWWGVVTSALAFYVGAATLFRDLWGREVLPQGFTKAYLEAEKIMRPRIVVHSGTHKGFEDKKEHTHGDEAV